MAQRGAFIVFEGIDRCGKSTQCARLVQELNKKGVKAVQMRFPGILISYMIIRNAILPIEAVHR